MHKKAMNAAESPLISSLRRIPTFRIFNVTNLHNVHMQSMSFAGPHANKEITNDKPTANFSSHLENFKQLKMSNCIFCILQDMNGILHPISHQEFTVCCKISVVC